MQTSERPPGRRLTPIEAVIEVVKSDCPDHWSRYCHLAHQLVPEKKRTEVAAEEAGRRHLAADGESSQQSAALSGGALSGSLY